jgi:hypothetical protein
MMINMALLFSAVTVTANDQEVEFLVGGIPREFDDLEGWTAFDNFMEDLDEETEVAVHAKAYQKVTLAYILLATSLHRKV